MGLRELISGKDRLINGLVVGLTFSPLYLALNPFNAAGVIDFFNYGCYFCSAAFIAGYAFYKKNEE